MSRTAVSLVALIAACGSPVLAADWEYGDPDFRGGYGSEPKDWGQLGDDVDTIAFEFGTRYWYSWGAQNFNVGASNFATRDNTHAGELHLRIDDYATRTYVKGLGGYSSVINGSYTDPTGTDNINDGKVFYAGGDFGWNAFGDGNGSGIGPFAGYLFWNDSPKTTRLSFTTATSSADVGFDPDTGATSIPFDSVDNDLNISALRLGISGRAKFSDMFDISAEVAAVPYALVSGTIGGHGFDPSFLTPLGNISFVKSSATEVHGWGYGAMGEVMAGFTPVENLTFRIGGRAWYLQGAVDATFSAATIGDPTDSAPPDPGPPVVPNLPNFDTAPAFSNQTFVSSSNPFSLFRYGLLAEFTYSF